MMTPWVGSMVRKYPSAREISDGVARSVRTRFDALTLRETPLL